ncbi:MAG: outer membrane beta-barrel protein, partial [Pseudomonadota bacterium]
MLDPAFVFTHRCLLIGLCLGSVALAKQTFADGQDGLYIGFALAPQFFSDNKAGDATVEFDTGIAFSALAGYKLSNLRLEGELAYQTVEGTSTANINADIDIIRFTGAAYYDFELFSLTPYLGGGMGIASLDSSGDFENHDSGFTWHGEVGLTINLTDQLAILPA